MGEIIDTYGEALKAGIATILFIAIFVDIFFGNTFKEFLSKYLSTIC